MSVRVGEVGDAGDALRVARLDDDLEHVRGEHLWLPALPPASVSLVMLLRSAEANTSAGAPSLIWATRSDEPAKLKRHLRRPGCSAMNASPISVNAAVSDAAANTATEPVSESDESDPHAMSDGDGGTADDQEAKVLAHESTVVTR